ncbi:MAG: hypothetical protein PHY92_04000 [Alphaproteobacteria bacterium]|nr:hypothetical protein [Alphaproteobacteria bacterium]
MNQALVGRLLAGLSTAIVVIAVTVAIVQNPPGLQRLRKLDERRVQDLERITNSIENYWRTDKVLPADLAAVDKKYGIGNTDPETKAPYIYEKTGERNYKLCAVFAVDSGNMQNSRHHYTTRNWKHGKGRHCFDFALPNTGNVMP